MRTDTVAVCRSCRVSWQPNEQPPCADTTHSHELIEMHVHDDVVTLQDGTAVSAVSFAAAAPYDREQAPAFGLYLDQRWQPPWEHRLVDWPDFGLPADGDAFASSLAHLLQLARDGTRVEVGCLGGHGRTGTALACLAVLAGCAPTRAVAWVRTHYCPRAVETPDQESFVAGFGSPRGGAA